MVDYIFSFTDSSLYRIATPNARYNIASVSKWITNKSWISSNDPLSLTICRTLYCSRKYTSMTNPMYSIQRITKRKTYTLTSNYKLSNSSIIINRIALTNRYKDRFSEANPIYSIGRIRNSICCSPNSNPSL